MSNKVFFNSRGEAQILAELDTAMNRGREPTRAGNRAKDEDLHLALTDEDWGECLPDSTWYAEEIDHMTRSGQHFKLPHLDQAEASGKDREVEK